MEKQFVLQHGDMQIPCLLTEPDHCPVSRCILGVHGFGAGKDTFVLSSIAEEMAIFGAATVRFDFPGHGDNALTDRELTLDTCRSTLLAAAEFIAKKYPLGDICVFASGFGAYVTLLAMEELEQIAGRIRLVLQTPNVRMAESLLTMTGLTEDAFRERGRVTLDAARKLEIPYSFYRELRENVTYTNYQTPMLLLHGELDYVVRFEDIANFNRINDLSKLVVIPGADHQFRTEGAWDMVVDLTRDWFEYEQVLLCDWS